MKLEILVTHFVESEDIVKPLLDSIAMQKDIPFREFGVIIVNDGKEGLLSDEFLSQYPFKIQYLIMEKGNVSKARNYALDHATAKYVMFCDCDDKFFIDQAFWWLFREMKKPFDILVSLFFEEKDGLGIPHDHDNTFIHGKVYNREYLIKNNIRFDEELYVHEDGYFVVLALCCTDKLRYFPTAFYLWVSREGSVARQEGFTQKTWSEYIKAKRKLINQLLARGEDEAARLTLGVFLVEAKERNLNQENMLNTAKFYREFKDLYDKLTKEDLKEIEKQTSEMHGHKTSVSTAYYERLLTCFDK